MEQLDTARDIFLKYGGSYFHMDREGDYGYYKSFGVSKEQELAWIEEKQRELSSEIKNETNAHKIELLLSEWSDILYNYNDVFFFALLLDAVREKRRGLDSFSQLLVAERIVHVLGSLSQLQGENDVLSDGKDLALELLHRVLNSPITIAEEYRNTDYLSDVITKRNIVARASKAIEVFAKR
ncbi:hypothetical protein [Alicyclobacillus sp. SO9]|uniref:hypothetical protein n=1 Tax=Alicyclobacillus sp. SO9 TaxID=2665646 RepID=UPI0018E77686|nr:hypothetical protein [Alicyclobacillus sp. SO9]QQE80618.1 hypothetical protein GI364_09580 [Alicyclobacillus sp. SO9]